MDVEKDGSKDLTLLYKNNQYHYLVDSLPFVDTISVELDPKVKELVENEMKLILEESGCSESELLDKYIEPLPYTHLETTNLIKNELDRISKGSDMDRIDFSKYSSVGEHPDLKSKLNHVKTLMEFSQDSLINLELMDRYKEGSWLKHLDSLTLLKSRLEKDLKFLDQRVEEVNKRRKLSQIETANRLRSINQEFEEYKLKNRQLLLAIEQLQQSKQITFDDL